MKNEGFAKEFPSAQKIYGALLRAYPPAHRAEYGAAMAQLFRDQCRDAWGESKNFGLLKLWLRVLPDWAKTSIMERLAALNERKTMNEKLANLGSFQTPPSKIFFRVFAAVFLLVLFFSAIITFMLPESFASTAMMKVENDQPVTGNQNYDPYFIQTQFEIIKSDAVLSNVITALNLNQVWGRRFFKGETLHFSETLEILKGRLSLAPVGNTKLMKVVVYGEDKNEPAQIANAIAESYRDYRIKTSNWKSPLPQPIFVQITDLAEPSKAPIKPNKTLNIVLGGFFGLLLAGVLGGVAFFISKSHQRKRAPEALAGN